jgi:hypothetical protein
MTAKRRPGRRRGGDLGQRGQVHDTAPPAAPPIIDAPEPYKSLIAAVMAADREACAAAADGVIERAYVPGEFWPLQFPQGTRVRVTFARNRGLLVRARLLSFPAREGDR